MSDFCEYTIVTPLFPPARLPSPRVFAACVGQTLQATAAVPGRSAHPCLLRAPLPTPVDTLMVTHHSQSPFQSQITAVFKTGRPLQPNGWSVRLWRRSVRKIPAKRLFYSGVRRTADGLPASRSREPAAGVAGGGLVSSAGVFARASDQRMVGPFSGSSACLEGAPPRHLPASLLSPFRSVGGAIGAQSQGSLPAS